MVSEVKRGKFYRVMKDISSSGCGCSRRNTYIFYKDQTLVADRDQTPDRDGEFKFNGEYINKKYLEEV